MGIGKIIGIILAIHFTLGLIIAICANVAAYKEKGRIDGDDVSASFIIIILGVVSFLTVVISVAEFLEENRPLEQFCGLIANKINKLVDKVSKKGASN